MSVQVTIDQLKRLAPNMRRVYYNSLEDGQAILDRYRVSDNNLRICHFFAQVLHECGALTIFFEDLNYSSIGLVRTWPRRFKPLGPLDPDDYANNPQLIADAIYGGRMGNSSPGDGYSYRGHGMLQLTGKDSYRSVTKDIRQWNPAAPDFVSDPDSSVSATWSLAVGAAEWAYLGCNELADEDNIRRVTYRINGGYTGLAQREEWLRRTKAVWG
jgi:putative chitinase